ncbi:ABC transporter ATP-binding protein [Desulfurispira natronophila]|uniref:ABC-2 type transport system ATP-binding protein n=1 Tax=Desulfurispira natronophila TaxID=682562 RepID=A0A7W7Y3Q6_9BACT|nr:ABC transporter ATP-binding protein [Desulfurispira natronophila]MBB5021531.1 ABC-2 type transport system ATP-binding protein [Desulfurispira natronophila]
MIQVESLCKAYKNTIVLDDISFRVNAGEVYGLLGVNGAGKTTTMKILTTLARPDSGRVLIDGKDIVRHRSHIRSIIGLVPQERNLDRELSAWENLAIQGLLYRMPHLPAAIERQLKAVGLWNERHQPVVQFSGGQQRRLLIARALLCEPQVLFMDEPSIGLDPQVRHQLWQTVRDIAAQGITVVLTTHYMEEAQSLCSRIGILHAGKLLAQGSLAQLQASLEPSHSQEPHRPHPDHAPTRKPSLEDIFLHFTRQSHTKEPCYVP